MIIVKHLSLQKCSFYYLIHFFWGGGMGVKGCKGGGLIFVMNVYYNNYNVLVMNFENEIIKLNTPQHIDKQTRQNLNFSVQSNNICSHNFYYFNH